MNDVGGDENRNYNHNGMISTNDMAGWAYWSFDAGRQYQPQQLRNAVPPYNMTVCADTRTRNVTDIRSPTSSNVRCASYNRGQHFGMGNQPTPPGLNVRPEVTDWAGDNHFGNLRFNRKGNKKGMVPALNIPKRGSHVDRRPKGKIGKGKGTGDATARSFSTHSNSSSRVSSRNNNTTIKTNSKQRDVLSSSKGANRVGKRERIEYVRKLLESPDVSMSNPADLVTDIEEKQNWRPGALELWGRLGDASDVGPVNPEYGFTQEIIPMAKMGKEFLRMSRTGDHFSDGELIKIWTRQLQQTGRCDYPNFRPTAYQTAISRYMEPRSSNNLQ